MFIAPPLSSATTTDTQILVPSRLRPGLLGSARQRQLLLFNCSILQSWAIYTSFFLLAYLLHLTRVKFGSAQKKSKKKQQKQKGKKRFITAENRWPLIKKLLPCIGESYKIQIFYLRL